MEVLTVDARKLTSLASKIEALKNQVSFLQAKTEDKKLKKWMDTQEVLQVLNVTVQTIQAYRDKGMLPYSQEGMKFFYKPEDVDKLLLAKTKKNNG